MNTQEQITALKKGINNLTDYIKNADLESETSVDLVFGDDLTESEIEYLDDLGNNFDSFSVFHESDFVTAEQLELIITDFNSELDNLTK